MLKLPNQDTAADFLEKYWQKRPLFMPRALPRLQPAVTRNELAWLATHDDVESRIVFVERSGNASRYRAENGPFDVSFLQQLPKRDWTLLVHDVEKHIPQMRALFRAVPFIPDWRIDDLMVSFAAPGGGVGPHRDNYDVFLCQGIGVRNWCFSDADIAADANASDDLALLNEFSGSDTDAVEGDVLYLPPGVAHWGVAKRACLTYSIGMRAPEAADLAHALQLASPDEPAFYTDPDLQLDEVVPGYLSPDAVHRASALMNTQPDLDSDVALALGQFATQNKDWLRPDGVAENSIRAEVDRLLAGAAVKLHGMAQIAFDDRTVFVNGTCFDMRVGDRPLVEELCAERRLKRTTVRDSSGSELLAFLLAQGAFEIPANS